MDGPHTLLDPDTGAVAHALTGPVLDGYTRAMGTAEDYTRGWWPRLLHLQNRWVTNTRWRDRCVERGGPWVELPDGEGVGVLRCSGRGEATVRIEVDQRVHLACNLDTGRVVIQWHARELWREGCSALRRWADLLEEWLLVDGLRVTGVEICRDFQGLEFAPQDLDRIKGKARCKIENYGDRDGGGATLYYGDRTSERSLVLYDKTKQAAKKKNVLLSTYEPTWRRSPHFIAGAPVTRVELRVSGRVLDVDGVDLRSVEEWTPETVAEVWRDGTRRHAMTRANRARRRECDTDPRWWLVQGGEPQGRMGSVAFDVDEREARRRCAMRVIRELHRMARLTGETTPRGALVRALALQAWEVEGSPEDA